MEKKINLLIGSVILTNLYYLSPLLGIPNSVVIIFCVGISSFFCFRRLDKKNLNLNGSKFIFSILILSFFLFGLNTFTSTYDIYPNDALRLLLYLIYFNWTFSLFHGEKELFESHFLILMEIIFFIVILVSIFEYFNYYYFKKIVFSDFTENAYGRRLAITFRDSNSYAVALNVFLFLYLKLCNNFSKLVVAFILTFILVNMTGSRLGLLISLLIAFPVIKDVFRRLNVVRLLVVALISLLVYLNANPISFKLEKSSTVYDRLFDEAKSNASSRSTSERIHSLEAGIQALTFRNLILPPGNFLFRSKWKTEIKARHFPHSSFIYMLVEYGIYSFWPLLILFKVIRISKNKKFLLLLMLLNLAFLPNAMYYSTMFLIIFYLDYENSYSTTIIKK